MRILFIGTVRFSFEALKLLINSGEEITGVCTKSSSGFNSDFVDLSPLCIEKNIPFLYVDDINSQEVLDWIIDKKPDVIYCFGWSNLIKKPLLNVAPLGVVGFHPAKLPQNRGRHPLIWALALGLKETASTFFFMKEGADDGDLLSQVIIDIEYADNASILYGKVIQAALGQILEFTKQLKNNNYRRTKQDHSLSNIWRKRNIDDGKIDFRMNSRSIYNQVRALSEPYVGAHIEYKGNNFKVWEIKEIDCNRDNLEPGLILEVEPYIVVKCYGGAIQLIRHEFEISPCKGEYL